jgi:hypothetical protein
VEKHDSKFRSGTVETDARPKLENASDLSRVHLIQKHNRCRDLNVDGPTRALRLNMKLFRKGWNEIHPSGAVQIKLLPIVVLLAAAMATTVKGQALGGNSSIVENTRIYFLSQEMRKSGTVLTSQGQPVGGAKVRVCPSTATGETCSPLAHIYSNEALTQPLANPLTTNDAGEYTFYISPGTYQIEIAGAGIATKEFPNMPQIVSAMEGSNPRTQSSSDSSSLKNTIGLPFITGNSRIARVKRSALLGPPVTSLSPAAQDFAYFGGYPGSLIPYNDYVQLLSTADIAFVVGFNSIGDSTEDLASISVPAYAAGLNSAGVLTVEHDDPSGEGSISAGALSEGIIQLNGHSLFTESGSVANSYIAGNNAEADVIGPGNASVVTSYFGTTGFRVVGNPFIDVMSNFYSPPVRHPEMTYTGRITAAFYSEDQGTDYAIYSAGGQSYHAGLFTFGTTARLTPGLFSTLSVCNPDKEGTEGAVADSTVNTWGATIAGGGSYHVLAYCNGANWTVAAK